MSDPKTTAMLATFTDLRAAERARNADIRASAQLIVTMIESSEQAVLQFGEGQRALEHAGQSLVTAISARGHTVNSHADLAKVARRNNMDWTMAGDNGATYRDDEMLRPSGALRPDVASASADQ